MLKTPGGSLPPTNQCKKNTLPEGHNTAQLTLALAQNSLTTHNNERNGRKKQHPSKQLSTPLFNMHQHQTCFEFLAEGSFLSSEDQGDFIRSFPALPRNFDLAEPSLVACTRNSIRCENHRRPSLVIKKEFSWLSVFQEFFVSKTVFHFADDERRPEDMTISWSTSDEDSDISTVPGLDEWNQAYDYDFPSEEDIFCVETVLRRTPSRLSPGELEESVLVTFSALE